MGIRPGIDMHASLLMQNGSNRGTKRSVCRQVRRRQVFQVSCGATGGALLNLDALQKVRAVRRSRKGNKQKDCWQLKDGPSACRGRLSCSADFLRLVLLEQERRAAQEEERRRLAARGPPPVSPSGFNSLPNDAYMNHSERSRSADPPPRGWQDPSDRPRRPASRCFLLSNGVHTLVSSCPCVLLTRKGIDMRVMFNSLATAMQRLQAELEDSNLKPSMSSRFQRQQFSAAVGNERLSAVDEAGGGYSYGNSNREASWEPSSAISPSRSGVTSGYDADPPPETRSLYGSSDNRAAGGGAYIGGRLDARTDYVRARDYQTRYAENKYSAYPSAAGVERRGGYGYDRYGP